MEKEKVEGIVETHLMNRPRFCHNSSRECLEESDFDDPADAAVEPPYFGSTIKNATSGIKRIFSKVGRKDSSLKLELLDDAWLSSDNDTSMAISKIKERVIGHYRSARSTPNNSMDLEWEHLPEMIAEKKLGEKPTTDEDSGTSVSVWSKGSSRDSLEWDPVYETNDVHFEEKDRLLREIEKLDWNTLLDAENETS